MGSEFPQNNPPPLSSKSILPGCPQSRRESERTRVREREKRGGRHRQIERERDEESGETDREKKTGRLDSQEEM